MNERDVGLRSASSVRDWLIEHCALPVYKRTGEKLVRILTPHHSLACNLRYTYMRRDFCVSRNEHVTQPTATPHTHQSTLGLSSLSGEGVAARTHSNYSVLVVTKLCFAHKLLVEKYVWSQHDMRTIGNCGKNCGATIVVCDRNDFTC